MPAMALHIRASGDNVTDIGPAIAGTGWALLSLSIITVVARFYVRRFIVKRIGWDDWTMAFALVLAIVNMITAQLSIHYGIGRHMGDLSEPDKMEALKWMYTTQPTAIMFPAFGRISFALLLLGILVDSQTTLRASLWVIIFGQVAINAVQMVLGLTGCVPIQRMWDKSIDGTCRPLNIIEEYGYFHGSFNTVVDFVLAVAPAFYFRKLKLRQSQKMALSALMGFGIIACGASIGKVVHLKALGTPTDITYNNALLRLWSLLEGHIVVVTASVPSLRPLFVKRTGTTVGTSQRTHSMSLKSMGRGRSRGYPKYPDNVTVDVDSKSSQELIIQADQATEPAHTNEMDIRKTTELSVSVSDSDGTTLPKREDNWK